MSATDIATVLTRLTIAAESLRCVDSTPWGDIYALSPAESRGSLTRNFLPRGLGEIGYWPLLYGEYSNEGQDTWLRTSSSISRKSADDLVQQGVTTDLELLVQQRIRSMREVSADESWMAEGAGGVWLSNSPALKIDDLQPTSILLLPTRLSWSTPALLNFGGWNECPPPDIHVTSLKHWHDVYGAEVTAMTSDRLVMSVDVLPASRKEALTLVWQQVFGEHVRRLYAHGSPGARHRGRDLQWEG